jgi:electron transfer flavoprotein beta subunit
MKILVCITHVPDTTAKIAFTEGDTKFDTSGVQYIIGPYDDFTLARAVELKEQTQGEITVLNVGTVETEPTIRKALAIGADNAIRIDADPIDALFVAEQIAGVAKEGSYDLILMGRESIDYNGGVVHGMVGELLGIPSVSPVMKLDIEGGIAKMEKAIDGGKQIIEADLPFVAGCQEPIAEWKIPNMRGIMQARSKPLEVKPVYSDEKGAILVKHTLPEVKSGCKLVDANNVQELVDLLINEAKVI